MHSLRRLIVKAHLRNMARKGWPVGRGMAIFLDDFIGEKILLDGGFDLEELGCLERDVLPHVTAGTVCLDIGANIGNHARVFAKHFDRIYAFEPHPRIFGLLSANAYGHEIVPVNYGLSDRAGRFAVEENVANLGASRLVSDAAGHGPQYDVQRLDDVVDDLVEGEIGFVKIDVEGHEAQVIRGGAETFRRHRPIVTFEVLAGTVVNGAPEAVSVLRALGYGFFYRLQPRAAWRRLKPSLLSRLLRAAGRLRSGQRLEQLEMVPFTALGPQEIYAVLIASTTPLNVARDGG